MESDQEFYERTEHERQQHEISVLEHHNQIGQDEISRLRSIIREQAEQIANLSSACAEAVAVLSPMAKQIICPADNVFRRLVQKIQQAMKTEE